MVLLLCGLILLWGLVVLAADVPDTGGDPLKGASSLASLPDGDLETAVIVELARETSVADAGPTQWRTLREPARHLWSLSQSMRAISQYGLEQWLKDHQQGATGPGPQDFAAAAEAMRLVVLAPTATEIAGLGEAAPHQVAPLSRKLSAALNDPATIATRRAWIREHLRDVLGRD